MAIVNYRAAPHFLKILTTLVNPFQQYIDLKEGSNLQKLFISELVLFINKYVGMFIIPDESQQVSGPLLFTDEVFIYLTAGEAYSYEITHHRNKGS